MILYSRIKVMGVILHIWALGNCIMGYRQSWPCSSFFITDYYIITTSEVIFSLQAFGLVVHSSFPNQLGVGSILLPPHICVSVCLEQDFSLRFIYTYISHLNLPITSLCYLSFTLTPQDCDEIIVKVLYYRFIVLNTCFLCHYLPFTLTPQDCDEIIVKVLYYRFIVLNTCFLCHHFFFQSITKSDYSVA